MKNGFRVMVLCGGAVIGAALPAIAQGPGEATGKDLQRLQGDLERLDAVLSSLEPDDAKADDFRTRAKELEEDVVYLKVKLRRHQRSGAPGTGLSGAEVAEVRRETSALRDDVERAFGARRAEIWVPAATELLVRLDEPLSSRTARREDRFECSLHRPLRVDGQLALSTGVRFHGLVRGADPAERPSRAGRLVLEVDTLELDRERLPLQALVVDIGDRERKGMGTAKKAGLGSVLGGMLGAVIGGGKGAVIGVIAGGGGAVLATKGEDVELPVGTILTVRLERALDLSRTADAN